MTDDSVFVNTWGVYLHAPFSSVFFNMNRTLLFIIISISTLLTVSCTKGKACLCERFDKESGEYEDSKYTEDFETCTGASFVLSNEDPLYNYDCYDYHQQNNDYYK